VDVNAADEKGYVRCMSPRRNGYHGIIKVLLENGADLNPLTNSRVEKDYGTGISRSRGTKPLGIVEGTFTGGIIRDAPGDGRIPAVASARSRWARRRSTRIFSRSRTTRTRTVNAAVSRTDGNTSTAAPLAK